MLRYRRVMSSLVQIDGSLGEGGGQVLRIALTLSTLYGIPIEITNIRAGRPKPGLAAQHLQCVEIAKQMCNAEVIGGYKGSTRLEYHPGPLVKHKKVFEADTKTAGCICLLAQVALPCVLFLPCDEPVNIVLKGGTNVPMGPQIEYLTDVFRPMLKRFGADFHDTIHKRGFYPKGGGEVSLQVSPIRNLNAVTLVDPGVPQKIGGSSFVSGAVHINAARKMANDAKTALTNALTENNMRVPPINIQSVKEYAKAGNASGINIVCVTSTNCNFGGSGLDSGPRDARSSGEMAAKEILKPLLAGACVDERMQDQMIILMTLAKGVSKIKVGDKQLTSHTDTAIRVAEMMLADRGLRFDLSESTDDRGASSYVLECQGCGLFSENSSVPKPHESALQTPKRPRFSDSLDASDQ
ncbi:PREDICTED: RNA 3'-terminal phosphate cyclase [Dinoponera quadriceps]|uniref:RNA 3'-terminal phosphate cyclase n=1 Tax=Dinoponera quadriceps TaxID=609295 RepID=A0A6P3WNY4_DINQU|nr:PREDICTED: RNA 3'-terminal phosphate cyclase [Dinoponera quadriceps]